MHAVQESSIAALQVSHIELLPEFAELLAKVNQVTFQEPAKQLGARDICLGNDATGRTIVFIKQPTCNKWVFTRQPYATNEQLGYLLSRKLQLNVVPPTMAIEGYKEEIEKIPESVREHLSNNIGRSSPPLKGIVLQAGVPLHKTQYHTDTTILRERFYCMVALNFTTDQCKQACIEDGQKAVRDLAIDLDQIARAIFYNIITGRSDAERRNSVIDESMHVKEIDNEFIGGRKTNSWLLETFSSFGLSKKEMDKLLAFDASVIDSVFQEMSHFPPIKFWDYGHEGGFTREDTRQATIKSNFIALQTFLSEKKDSPLTIGELCPLFHQQSEAKAGGKLQ